jgi:hypothetical protein
MGQAIASSSLVSPAAAAEPNSAIAEKTFEATADNVVNTLEAAYGVNRGKWRIVLRGSEHWAYIWSFRRFYPPIHRCSPNKPMTLMSATGRVSQTVEKLSSNCE